MSAVTAPVPGRRPWPDGCQPPVLAGLFKRPHCLFYTDTTDGLSNVREPFSDPPGRLLRDMLVDSRLEGDGQVPMPYLMASRLRTARSSAP